MSGSDRRENRENEDDFLKDFNPDEFSSPMVFAPQVPPPPPNTEQQQETQNSKVCLSLQLFRMYILPIHLSSFHFSPRTSHLHYQQLQHVVLIVSLVLLPRWIINVVAIQIVIFQVERLQIWKMPLDVLPVLEVSVVLMVEGEIVLEVQ